MNLPAGIVAEFATPESFVAAVRAARHAGYSRFRAYTPYPVAEADEWLPAPPTPMAKIMLAAGVAGGSGAYFLQWFAAHDYAINVGGRPIHSWPAFIPVTFELTVLTSAVAGVIALLILCGLPRLHHAIFSVDGFERATTDRFFLHIEHSDPRFDPAAATRLLTDAGATTVHTFAS